MTVIAAAASSTSDASAGLIGFIVIVGLGVALFFILRSMNNQFKKLPPPDDSDQPGGPGGKRPRAGLAAYRAAQRAQRPRRTQGGDRESGTDDANGGDARMGAGIGRNGGNPGRS